MFQRLLTVSGDIEKSFFLFGPRSTGKTSWVKAHFPDALYIDLLKNSDYIYLQADPSRLETMAMASKSRWVVIDEVQKIPALLDEVHRLIEAQGKLFVLTGSSARKLRRGGANLLAGRALTYHMHPLVVNEIGERVDFGKVLTCGLLPSAYLETNAKAFLESYVATYLRQEVMEEGLVRNIGTFGRFMEIASFSQGSQLNLSSIAREVGVSRKIVENYFEILDDLLIAVQLRCFSKRAKRELVQHPKFYYFDLGVFRQLRPKGPLDVKEEIGGAAFETLFLQHLRAIIDYHQLDLDIYFWRTKTGTEVDFVLYGERGLFAFEIKSSAYVEKKDFFGLKTFKKDYPAAQCFLIYAGERLEQYGDISVIPMPNALFGLLNILNGNKLTSK